jgi:ABC-type multidrug transport system ATPase subunit
LRHDADRRPRLARIDVLIPSPDRDLSCGLGDKTGKDVDQGRFARAVRSQQAKDRAFWNGQIDTLPSADGISAEHRPDGTVALTYRAGQTAAEDVLALLRENGIRLRDVRTEQADLEDVFLDMTRSA